jgi:hypothetical protein
MDIGLAIAGVICLAMAVGHNTIGLVWVLPGVKKEHLSASPFGPQSMSESMIRVSWFIVTIFVAAVGVLLLTLAFAEDVDARVLTLRLLAVMWGAATLMAGWIAVRRVGSMRGLMRLPVPLLWVTVGVLCWVAST